ncbi:DUF6892 domain-containing protein [Cytophaga hutchinsonii]|uniref:Uncharacterized protein n=1 Tax=Cytophaga hutchinsonii (strain ATCC 33406 / DSM 1761 / CIP 103989 / NBRC 15051 / NCIMB 9469 / D465) TaxID=269798 RepID=A0A6N4STA5_CYTH3|nr:hypothetical protein [Cytophaga hutchinsonii]ABG59650.1 conserved hypothetical protein [Cytophaga hutchinsonii ATCC 33406]SFX66573.1 hypothetical protein SAMN04487930_107139 [Cytophaga hutchinsonii ATCC 33406]
MLTINLTSTDFQINKTSITFPVAIETLRTIFAVSDRVNKKKHNTIYTWDALGVLAYSKDGKMADGLYLTLKTDTFDFSCKQIFSGVFHFNNEEIITYYNKNKNKRVALFDGDSSGAFVLNDISVWFDLDDADVQGLEIKAYDVAAENELKKKNEIPKDTYIIKKLEEEIVFVDFGFKLAIIQELMYNKKMIQPEFDLFEFVKWYPHRKIDLEKEGYQPIAEVTQYFKDLPIPQRLAAEITGIYQDGGNDIYLNLLRFGEGWETYWDIESIDDVKKFPNLKEVTLCYAKEHVLAELNAAGIQAEWI